MIPNSIRSTVHDSARQPQCLENLLTSFFLYSRVFGDDQQRVNIYEGQSRLPNYILTLWILVKFHYKKFALSTKRFSTQYPDSNISLNAIETMYKCLLLFSDPQSCQTCGVYDEVSTYEQYHFILPNLNAYSTGIQQRFSCCLIFFFLLVIYFPILGFLCCLLRGQAFGSSWPVQFWLFYGHSTRFVKQIL